MTNNTLVDHLFRHQYGKMVSILTRIFGLSNLETIEDAVQDTFARAVLSWRNNPPENPEAWLTKAAKNRAIDLFRKIKADQNRLGRLESGPSAMVLSNLFLDHEIEDSQLRMIFTTCHPQLNPKDQIVFSLKTISGFSTKEIASALLLKEETIKKRIARARKSFRSKLITFEIPDKRELPQRIQRVQEVLYLIFNEGFHSNRSDLLIRKELCAEAMRLCQILVNHKLTAGSGTYALFALMCFHAARLDSKVNQEQRLVDLKNQDRSKWHAPLIILGNDMMNKAVEDEVFTPYHYEAAIAAEHVKARNFEETSWERILMWYERLNTIQYSELNMLNMAVVLMQLKQFDQAKQILDKIDPNDLEQRAYLYYSTRAEYYYQIHQYVKAIESLDKALFHVTNQVERNYLNAKKQWLLDSINS